MAIRDINRAHERVSQLQALLLQLPAGCSWSQIGGGIVEEILRLNTSALSALQSPGGGCASSDDDGESSAEKSKRPERKGRSGDQKRRRKSEAWTIVTTVPYEDGHQWRKYGQKIINNAKHPRSYFRCTYKEDQKCMAKKTVQQEDGHGDPPRFKVEYRNHHTCKAAEYAVLPFVMDSSLTASMFHGSGFQQEQNLSSLSSSSSLIPVAAPADCKSSSLMSSTCDPSSSFDMLGRLDNTEFNSLFQQPLPIWDPQMDLLMVEWYLNSSSN
ncbi:putative WRKY transcription factor 70 [Canna indica]|uniref:WRKY transcription factor 70 n=1 Tax=Canna indica TaxID=4628 RepID=A0AAQ3JUQ4_9LILI|nr:putative WRKY transcription factor 70 [Canna indica]